MKIKDLPKALTCRQHPHYDAGQSPASLCIRCWDLFIMHHPYLWQSLRLPQVRSWRR